MSLVKDEPQLDEYAEVVLDSGGGPSAAVAAAAGNSRNDNATDGPSQYTNGDRRRVDGNNNQGLLAVKDEFRGISNPNNNHHNSSNSRTLTADSGDIVRGNVPKMYYGRLSYKDHTHLIHELCIDIGRNSTKSIVHFHVSKNSFISRKHMQIRFQPETNSFYLKCLSKNGIFVDGNFQRTLIEPVLLPKT